MYIPFWVIIIVGAVIFIFYKSKKQNTFKKLPINIDADQKEKNDLNQDSVLEIQKKFEEKIELKYLPDRIEDRDIYIYKSLMRPWYNKLINKNYYNFALTKSITTDWINYIKALEEEANCRCLYKINFESENEEEINYFIDRGRIEMEKINKIEKNFANSIGDDALERLSSARNVDEEKIPQLLLKTNIKERLDIKKSKK